MPRRPRLFEPHLVYDVTIQTVDREFLLKPTPEIRNIVGASFARAQHQFPISFHYGLANVNHPHLGVSANEDTLDNLEPFFNLSLSLIASETNRHWHRKGRLWASQAHITPCVDDEKAKERLFYGMTNPAKDGLAENGGIDRLATGMLRSCVPAGDISAAPEEHVFCLPTVD